MPPPVKWLFEKSSYIDSDALFEEVIKEGMEAKYINRVTDDLSKIYKDDDCVVFYGSLGTGAYLQRSTRWVPGVYHTAKHFACTSYYPVFGGLLLNSLYMMMPLGGLIQQKEWVFEVFEEKTALFVRPNSGGKLFTGQLIGFENFENDVKGLGNGNIEHSELVLISPPQDIVGEWRFIVVDNEVVCGSRYSLNGEHDEDPNYPPEALELAQHGAKLYSPDTAWCIDICETSNGRMFVLELGCFSCAGVYLAPLEPIVRMVSKAAKKDWEEANS